MGQRANSQRNASLDNKKSRAAGRQKDRFSPENKPPTAREQDAPPRTLGAFGSERTGGAPNRRASNLSKGGGGGGGAQSAPKD